MKVGLPLINNVLAPLGKSFLLPLGLMAEGTATDATIQKKIYVSGVTTMIVWNEEMGGITKIIKSLEQSYLFPEGAIETNENEEKE